MSVEMARLDVEHRFMLTTEDEVCEITHLLDEDGLEVSDPAEAVTFVAYNGRGHYLINGRVEDFPPPSIH
jgi:hypothetical protein